MKQFFCVLVALAASAALLFLVSAPINGEDSHGTETHSTEETHTVESTESDAH